MGSAEIFDAIGVSAEELREDFGEFTEATRALEESWAGLVENYPQQWIAFHDKKVVVHADTLEDVILMIHKGDLPRENIIVRYVETEPTTLIL